MKRYCLAVALILFLAASSVYCESKPLFKIERNKNANIVQYDVNIDTDGTINKKNPVDAYWMLYAKDGSREELSTFDKKAYGYKAVYNNEGYFDLTLKAVEDRKIKVILSNGEPKGEIQINRKTANLSKVYVYAVDGFMGIPKVSYYTLTGFDPESGEEVSEKIDVK